MQIILLGTGGPRIDLRRSGPSQVVYVDDEPILVDCGRGLLGQLTRANIPVNKIDRVLITHHHLDHISDFADFAIYSWFTGRERPLEVYGPRDTRSIVDALFKTVYKMDVESRLRVGERSGYVKSPPEFKVQDISAGLVLEDKQYKITAALVDHWRTAIPEFKYDALGFRIDSSEGSVCISGDTIPCEDLINLAKGSDVLVHECYIAKDEVNSNPHVRYLAGNIHTTSDQVGKVAKKANVKKLVLSHIKEKSDALLRKMLDDVKQDFDGEVIIGEDLLQVEV